MISDKTHKLFEEIAEYIIKLYKRAEKSEAMVERMIKWGIYAVHDMNHVVSCGVQSSQMDTLKRYVAEWNALVAEWKESE